jgi:hypothetical protein
LFTVMAASSPDQHNQYYFSEALPLGKLAAHGGKQRLHF